VPKDQRNAAAKLTAKLNIHLEDPVSTKRVRYELHKSNIRGTGATAKPLITENNAKRLKKDGVIIIKPGRLMIGNTQYGQTSRLSRFSQHQTEFMFGERPRKPIILNACFQL
jgi:hypothetical protein